MASKRLKTPSLNNGNGFVLSFSINLPSPLGWLESLVAHPVWSFVSCLLFDVLHNSAAIIVGKTHFAGCTAWSHCLLVSQEDGVKLVNMIT